MTEKIGYKLNPKKLKKAPQSILPYVCGAFYYTENYEYFDVIKPYLDIPEPRKSLEEISQELEEKFEELLVKTKRKFFVSKDDAEYRYYHKFKNIERNFEYAKTYGNFPTTIKLGPLDGSYLVANNTVPWSTEFRIGKTEVGYWDIKPNIKVYLEKKPNRIVRYFSKLLLDFTWKDK
jgi:hypothetical protein